MSIMKCIILNFKILYTESSCSSSSEFQCMKIEGSQQNKIGDVSRNYAMADV